MHIIELKRLIEDIDEEINECNDDLAAEHLLDYQAELIKQLKQYQNALVCSF